MKEPKPIRTPVGSSECPIKKCAEVVDVFKYAGDINAGRRRFAGRLFCMCPKHGRIENQEFLLEHMTWRENEKPTDAPPPPKAAAVPPKPKAPAPARASSGAPLVPKPAGPTDTLSSWFPSFFK